MATFGEFAAKRQKSLFALSALAAACGAIVIAAQLGANSFFLFEVFLSLLPQILLFCGVVIVITMLWQPRLAAGLAALTFMAAFPVVFHSKYETPTQSDCGPDECFKILTINLWGESDNLLALSSLINEHEVDIVAINEASQDTIDPNYQDQYFSNYSTVIHATWLNMPRGMGNPISFLSRKPVEDVVRVLNRDTGGRAYIAADLAEEWDGLRIVVAHARTPLKPSGLTQRNALIDDISEVAKDSESFILLGDFNMTPWSPKFRSLPGKRAGDPRFSRTWPTMLPLLGMSIDHIMFSDDLELVEFEILRSVGSDHYPVMAKFKRKDR